MKQTLLAILLASTAMAQTSATQTPSAAKTTSAAKSTAGAKSSTKAPAPAAPASNLLSPETLNRTAPATFRAKLTTTKGDVVIEVTRDWAPRGADRFYNLVRAGFYTDCSFYRTIAGFMTQFGISARPEVTRAWRDARLQDDPVKQSNTRGKITFATSGPNTRTTQLFINYGNNARLDALGFSPFGEVVEGMDVVDKLYQGYAGAPSDKFQFIEEGGKPYLDKNFPMLDRILTATIVPAAPAAPAATKSTTAPAATKSTAPKS
jgi:peptidyl-prolyl cis-trans isomerase A (cyclophilin A)